jgi:hypothetical protein
VEFSGYGDGVAGRLNPEWVVMATIMKHPGSENGKSVTKAKPKRALGQVMPQRKRIDIQRNYLHG